MKKLQYSVQIAADVSKVYDSMLGTIKKSTYEEWTALFNPTSSYEGSWEKGSKIYFIGTDENGEKGGMVSEISENTPNKFVSIRHLGILKGTKEILEGPDVEGWAGSYENYTFDANNGSTKVIVDLETSDDFIEYMDETYPKALKKLKEMCE